MWPRAWSSRTLPRSRSPPAKLDLGALDQLLDRVEQAAGQRAAGRERRRRPSGSAPRPCAAARVRRQPRTQPGRRRPPSGRAGPAPTVAGARPRGRSAAVGAARPSEPRRARRPARPAGCAARPGTPGSAAGSSSAPARPAARPPRRTRRAPGSAAGGSRPSSARWSWSAARERIDGSARHAQRHVAPTPVRSDVVPLVCPDNEPVRRGLRPPRPPAGGPLTAAHRPGRGAGPGRPAAGAA